MFNLLSWSFPFVRIFGIRVRIHFFLALLIAFFLLEGLIQGGGRALGLNALSMALLLVSVLAHELAHCGMAVRVGAGAEEILLGPLGGLSYIGHTGSPRDEIRIAAVGPLTNLLLSAGAGGGLVLAGASWDWAWFSPFGSWGAWSFTQQVLLHALKINLILGLFNLLVPAYPLDGGRILYAALTIRHGRSRAAEISARVALPVGVVIVLTGLLQNSILLSFVGFSVIFEAWQLLQLARMGAIESHPAFSSAPEFAYRSVPERRTGFFARWRRKRAAARARRDAEAFAAEESRIDAILDKINREGIGSLSREEKRILDEASRRRSDHR